MWWAVWCVAAVASSARAAAAPAPDSFAALPPLDLVQIDALAPDDDIMNYAESPVAARYSNGAGTPWLYYLAEPHDSQVSKKIDEVTLRRRRGFSVNPPVEVLQRGAYNYYLAKVAAHHNREFLDCVGKRDPSSADCKFNM